MNTIKIYCSVLNLIFKRSFYICLILISGCSDENKTDTQKEKIEVKKFSGKNSNALVKEFPNGDYSEDSEDENPVDSGPAVSPEKVKEHIGEIITVKGIITNVHVSEKVAYLNFGNKFPKNDFSGVVFESKFSEFEDLEAFKDKLVEITGSISVFRNKPQIILNSSDQIKIIK